MKVMTFNIHHGKGKDHQINLERVAEVIQTSRADIIGLNEVDRRYSKRSLFEDQIGWLAKQLNMEHAFSPSITLASKNSSQERQYGNGLLSKFPIMKSGHYSFDFIGGLIEGRSLLSADIQLDDRICHFFVTHLSLNPFLHAKQTSFIMGKLSECTSPAILVGDWNMRPGSKGWRKMTHIMQDAWASGGKGTGNTYPSMRPRTRLDYIFASPAMKVIQAEVITVTPEASDHLPLTATIKLDVH